MTANTESLPLFLGSVIAISLTGVMMPGPVTAVTVTKGAQRKGAGALIAIGHGIVEIPLILVIYLGFANFLTLTGVKIGVGLAGGLVLLWMAWSMFRTRPAALDEQKDLPHGSIIVGAATNCCQPLLLPVVGYRGRHAAGKRERLRREGRSCLRSSTLALRSCLAFSNLLGRVQVKEAVDTEGDRRGVRHLRCRPGRIRGLVYLFRDQPGYLVLIVIRRA